VAAFKVDHPQARAYDGRRCDCDERIGQGVSVYGAPPEQRRDALITMQDEVSANGSE